MYKLPESRERKSSSIIVIKHTGGMPAGLTVKSSVRACQIDVQPPMPRIWLPVTPYFSQPRPCLVDYSCYSCLS